MKVEGSGGWSKESLREGRGRRVRKRTKCETEYDLIVNRVYETSRHISIRRLLYIIYI